MKKGIIVVSFGTTHEETRRLCIESIEKRIAKEFSRFDVRRAFTSKMVINKLKSRDNLLVDTLEEALTKMKEEGFNEVYIQSLHVTPGKEYGDIVETVRQFQDQFHKLALGRPLLTKVEDYKATVAGLKKQLPQQKQGKAVLLMGHGTYHPANACYSCLQSIINDEGLNAYVGTVEDYPELQDILPKLKKANIKEAVLMPFMLVAGDHAKNDLAGDEDSWKTVLEDDGFKVEVYMHGLGENIEIQDIYIQHLKDAMAEQ
ncbi:sirohydrochlorin cobaltochelatase [Alkaliphilus pronyensis]|uniref:Sirohydrochlorin cobaltochelatase n=1 Tax=Alkaliphilus pronyensis TaxID=1482732 RepID=A0A6I0FIV4_9FIRM|nr:sirohydrochlorin cobaltochelatase [Alkaliphilus pronyensis]KAB3539047.1 sirohydrochlorin cobaltochelatase [Alkaliphilus pronyensis]